MKLLDSSSRRSDSSGDKSGSFWKSMEACRHVEELIGLVPEVHYFCKDSEGCFRMVDDGFVAMLGCSRREDVLGKTDFDFFSQDVARKFVTDDRRVMKTGVPIRHLAESIPIYNTSFSWRVVYKVPLRDFGGNVVGVAGIVTLMSSQNAPTPYASRMMPVLDYIGAYYESDISVGDLARIAGLSVRSFERNFKGAFQRSPIQYLNSVRLQAVRQALVSSDRPLSLIATETGFYDQSHMTASFRRHFGKTPRAYRLLHRGG